MILGKKKSFIYGTGSLSVKEPNDNEFECFRKLVLKELGLNWTGDKKYLLYSRLQRRLQFLKLRTFSEYYEHLQNQKNY